MKTIVIITPANIEVEYRLANAGSRLAAFVIDSAIQMAAVLLLTAAVLFGFEGLRLSTLGEVSSASLALIIIAAFVIQFGYFIVCELSMNGQTVGKRVFKLRVIRDNGQPVELSQGLVRNLIRPAVDMLYVGLFVIMFSKNHKRLGDMAAGTIVVSEHPAAIPPAVYIPDADILDVLPARPLTAEEKYLVSEWLRRRDSLPDGGEVIRNKWVDYFKMDKMVV
jgi:uncharacterized RDD family membrane protein YckC